jgi:hypothetical protein
VQVLPVGHSTLEAHSWPVTSAPAGLGQRVVLPLAGAWQLIVPAGAVLVAAKQQALPGAQSAASLQVTTTPVQASLAGSQVDVSPPAPLTSQQSFAGTSQATPLHVTDRVPASGGPPLELVAVELAPHDELAVVLHAELEAELDATLQAELDATLQAELDAELQAELDAELHAELDAELQAELLPDPELDPHGPQSRTPPQPSLIVPQPRPTPAHVPGTHRPVSRRPAPSLPIAASRPPPSASPSWTRAPQLAVVPAATASATIPSSACFMAMSPLRSSRAPRRVRRNPGWPGAGGCKERRDPPIENRAR